MELGEEIAVRETKTVYRSGDRTIKLFVEGYSKPDILNEALNLARVEEANLNIPRLLEVSMVDNRWGIAIEHIEGKSMADLMKENPDKKDEYLNQFVDIQLKVLFTEAPAMLNKLKEKFSRKIKSTDLSDTLKYELSTRLDGMPNHNYLCHGDFNPSNVIIKENGEAYIIDWAHVTVGNRSADAATTYLEFCLDGDKELAEKYLNLFTEKSGIPKTNIQRWIPIVAASQLANGKEQEFLRHWIDVMDYE